jgi:hypothetical protein
MNASQNNQRFNSEGSPSSPLLLAAICGLGVLMQAQSLRGEAEAAEPKAFSAGKKANTTFVQPPDPSTLPAPLPLPPEPSAPSALDLLPSFPPAAPAADFLDLVLKKRQNPSLVPDGPNPTEDAALALDKRHRYQTARVRAMNDPDILEALSLAQKARSDRELRAAMRRHYTLLFAKMRKLDHSLETLIQEREKMALGPLEEKMTRATSVTLKK